MAVIHFFVLLCTFICHIDVRVIIVDIQVYVLYNVCIDQMKKECITMSENKNKYFDINSGEIYENAERALEAQKELKEQEQLENADKNPPFIQLTKGISPNVIAAIAGESSTAIQTLMFFFNNMDDYNVIVVSQSVIAESIKSTTRSVARAIKVLENYGAIGIGKVGNANVYLINPHIAWQKKQSQRKTAILKANVILGEEESKRLQEKFGGVFDESKVKSLKVDNIATKIAMKKPKTQAPTVQPDTNTEEYDFGEYTPELSFDEEYPEEDTL